MHTFITPQHRQITVDALLDALQADYELRGKCTPQFLSHRKRIGKHFGCYRAVEVNSDAVDADIKAKLAEGYAPASINRGTQLLGQAYQLAVRNKHLSLGNVPYIRRLSELDNVRTGYFTEAEIRSVINFLPEYLKDFTLFAFITGWRKNSIASLRWEDVDGDVILVRAEDWKNREAQTMPIEDELAEIMERRRVAREVKTDAGVTLAKWVFHDEGERIGDFRKSWATASKRAGLDGRLFHDLCRCAARNMDNAGVPREVAKQIMGRKTDAIYNRYRIVNESDKRVGLKRRGEYMRSAAEEKQQRVRVMVKAASAAD